MTLEILDTICQLSKYKVIKATHNIQDVSPVSLSLKKNTKSPHGIFFYNSTNKLAGMKETFRLY